MRRRSKLYRAMLAVMEPHKLYPLADALATLKTMPAGKFDETV